MLSKLVLGLVTALEDGVFVVLPLDLVDPLSLLTLRRGKGGGCL